MSLIDVYQVEEDGSIGARAWYHNICMTSVKASLGEFVQESHLTTLSQ